MFKMSLSILLIVSFCHFLNDTIQSMLPAIYPVLKAEFGLSFSQIGLITLVLQLTSSLVQPLVGVYADKRHHSWQLSVAMLFTLSGLMLLSSATEFWMLLVSVALCGCGSSIFHPQGSQVAQLASGGRKGFAQGIFQVGGNAGYSLGPLLAGLIVLSHGMSSIRWFGILALLCAALLFHVGRWHVRAVRILTKKFRNRWIPEISCSRRKIYFFVFILFMLMFSKNFYSASMTSYFTFFLIDKFDVSIRTSQICLFIFLASHAVGTVVGGLVGDRFGRRLVIWFSILGVAPFTMILPYLDSFAATVCVSVVIGLIISSAFPAILVFATDLLPEHTGIVAGIFYGLSFGIAGLGSSVFGWVADKTSVQFVFQISTLLPFLGILAVFLPKMKRNAT